MSKTRRAALILAATIPAAWLAVALLAGQSPWSTQTSRLLLRFGAVDGSVLDTDQWWRLAVSMWLHVKAPHMLLNTVGVALAGGLVERWRGWPAMLGLYAVAGLAGQLASVLAYPALVTSGASQAMLGLCGAALLGPWPGGRPSAGWWGTLVVVVVQLALDVHVAGVIKAGHAVGLGLGLVAGLIFALPALRAALGRSRA